MGGERCSQSLSLGPLGEVFNLFLLILCGSAFSSGVSQTMPCLITVTATHSIQMGNPLSILLPSPLPGNGSSQGKLIREGKYPIWEERELLCVTDSTCCPPGSHSNSVTTTVRDARGE